MQASDNIMRDKWRKLFLNVALSASSAIADLTIGELLAIPEMAATARRAMDEAAAVAFASGVDIAARIASVFSTRSLPAARPATR